MLHPPPCSNTVTEPDQPYDYFESKYSYEDEDQLIGFDTRDGDRNDRTLVIGISHDGVARAYPFDVVAEEGIVEDAVGGRPVVVAWLWTVRSSPTIDTSPDGPGCSPLRGTDTSVRQDRAGS